MASGSACELETQLIIAADVDLLVSQESATLLATIARVKSMLHSLETSLTRQLERRVETADHPAVGSQNT